MRGGSLIGAETDGPSGAGVTPSGADVTPSGAHVPPSDPIPPLLLVGCGRMGGALLDGWVREGLAPSAIVDPDGAPVSAPHVKATSLAGLPADFSPATVVLAVKPQQAGDVLAALGARFPEALFLSIMAGRTIAGIELATGARAVVRAMPNTPAAIGRGIAGLYASPAVPAPGRALAERLLRAVGDVVWLASEEEMDAVTAVSGSGPAYVFLLAELLEQAGTRAGLSPAVARRLARATVSGAGALLAETDEDASRMREAVTSKAGTTERALAVLMAEGAWPHLVDEAVSAAAARARELSR